MNKFYLIVVLLSMFLNKGLSQGGVIILEGNYQGKNLYVQNPFSSIGVGFCVSEVLINGNITYYINNFTIKKETNDKYLNKFNICINFEQITKDNYSENIEIIYYK